MSIFKTQKKVELHLHLEGGAPPEFIRTLAREKNIDLSKIFDETGAYKWENFIAFLGVYEAACEVLQTPEDFNRLTEAVLAEQAAHGVIYTEHFLASDLCGGGDPEAWDDYLSAMIEGAENAKRDHGIEARFINTCIRHFGPEKAERAAEITANTKNKMLTGFGMGGDESHLMPGDFAKAYQITHEAGLGLTCHAGEINGPEMVNATLDALKVTRIGHGVRSIESEETMARLIAQDITLEVNPGSNISLSVYENWADHPITKLRDAGVKVTVSTDDPPYFHTTMTREYEMLNKHLGWDQEALKAQNLTAMEAAFCDEATKTRIVEQL